MRGKSPREMLGAIATSNLTQSTITATAAITLAIVLLTIVPFGLTKLFGTSDHSEPTAAENSESQKQPLATPTEPSLNPSRSPDAASQLGIGDAKTAPVNVNPLESSTDDLLEGLE